MDVIPTKDRGHLIVAAIRVLAHRNGAPPEPQQIAELLEWSEEDTRVTLRALADLGILKLIETPFELRSEVADYSRLEDLPESEDEKALEKAVEAFKKKSRAKKEALERMFSTGEKDKKKKKELEDLERRFREFRKKAKPPPI